MGWGIKKVSMLLGHNDISVTADVYTHLVDGDLKVRDSFLLSESSQPSKTLSLEATLSQISVLLAKTLSNGFPATTDQLKAIQCMEQEIENLKKQIQTNMETSGAKAPDFRFLLESENFAT